MWRWSNFLHRHSPPGLEVVRINMDETSIRLFSMERAGHLTLEARLLKRGPRSLNSAATTSQARGMLTLVAFVCDNNEIQNILPQILIVNEKHLSRAEPAAALRMHLGANTVLWTASKAWVTGAVMCKIVGLLMKQLAPYRRSHHFILSTDAYRAHLTRPVWRAVNRARIMYHLIPSKMTWVLQPCDTHVFAMLKNTLRRECQALALTQTDGRLTMTLLIRALTRTITAVLRAASWRSAFEDLGLTGVQTGVSDRVLQKVRMRDRPCVASDLPTLAELQAVFPTRSILPIDDMFGWFCAAGDAAADGHPVVPAAAYQPDLAAVNPLRPWAGRTRSSSSLPPPAPEPPPPAWPPSETTSAAPLSLPPQPPPRLVPRGRRLLPWLPRPPQPPPAPPLP